MARLTGQVELGSKIKVAPWLRLQETAKQKTSLNKHRGRYLASTEGGLESNRQGMVPELLEDGYIRGILVLVHRAHQLKWCNSTQKQNVFKVANASKFVLHLSFFVPLIFSGFSKQAKQNKQTKREDSGKQQGSSAACATAGKAKCAHGKQTVTEWKINK